MKKLFLISLFYFLFVESYAQVDSIAPIKLMLANEQSDSIKLELFKKLSWYYMDSQNDSANYYNQQMLDLAKKTKNPNAELLALSRMARAKWILLPRGMAGKSQLNRMKTKGPNLSFIYR